MKLKNKNEYNKIAARPKDITTGSGYGAGSLPGNNQPIKSAAKEFKGKKIIVAGLGKSGLSAIKKLSRFAGHIIAVDSNASLVLPPEIKNLVKKKNLSIEFILDENINKKKKILDCADLVVISPGISNKIPLIKEADKRKIPVWSEVELAWRLMNIAQKKNAIAITGTNGKTTTVNLINSILKRSGRSSTMCGNIGNPLLNTLEDKRKDLLRVIEISSFQLERCYSFNPYISVMLNITNDHLDRHHSMENYAEIKFSIFKNSTGKNWAVLNFDDEYIKKKLTEKCHFNLQKINIISYSLSGESNCEVYYKKGFIHYKVSNQDGRINISGASLTGNHNISNMMSAVAVSKILNITDNNIKNTINAFNPLEHRQEFVGSIQGIRVYNDSKATNPDATIKALESFERVVTLILGGKDKDMDFSVMLSCMDSRVLNLVLIGETKIRILKMLEKHSVEISGLPYNVFVCSSFEEAVEKGLEVTKKDHVLMLSPACASFDMFSDYKDRGNKFKKIILKKNVKKN